MGRVITTSACLTIILCFRLSVAIRVCPTLSDYNWWFNSECYDNPISEQNITEIIKGWGFTAEEHYVTTADGYQVHVERLYSKISQPNPIIIVHGIAMNPLAWVIREKISLAYLLANQGYDVWLVSYRGTTYSKKHVTLSTDQNEFWKYSVNEMGIYDVRGAVELVHNKTEKQSIYIGYSMGTTGFFIYSTTYPEEARKYVKGMIGLAPVINYKNVKSYATTVVPIWSTVKSIVYSLWHGEILPGYSIVLKPLSQFSIGIYVIQMFTNLIFGDDNDQIDPIIYPLFTSQLLDSIGIEVFTHYVQIYQSGRFQNYDYGKEENMKRYGTAEPPAYDLSKVSVPVALFVGANDWLATETNAQQLYSELKPGFRCGYHVVPYKKWNHIDFLVAKDIQKYLYDDLFRKIKQIASGKCAS